MKVINLRESKWVLWERLKGGQGSGKICNYILTKKRLICLGFGGVTLLSSLLSSIFPLPFPSLPLQFLLLFFEQCLSSHISPSGLKYSLQLEDGFELLTFLLLHPSAENSDSRTLQMTELKELAHFAVSEFPRIRDVKLELSRLSCQDKTASVALLKNDIFTV